MADRIQRWSAPARATFATRYTATGLGSPGGSSTPIPATDDPDIHHDEQFLTQKAFRGYRGRSRFTSLVRNQNVGHGGIDEITTQPEPQPDPNAGRTIFDSPLRFLIQNVGERIRDRGSLNTRTIELVPIRSPPPNAYRDPRYQPCGSDPSGRWIRSNRS